MKFAVFVSSLAIFAFLAGQVDATLESVLNELPNEIVKVLVAATEKPIKDTFNCHNVENIQNISLTYFWTAHPKVNELSIEKKTLGTSVASVSFNVNVPDAAPQGDVKLKKNSYYYDGKNYTGIFTSMPLSDAVLKLQAYYSPLIKKLIVKTEVTSQPEYLFDFVWEEDLPENDKDIETQITDLYTNSFAEGIKNIYVQTIREKQPELVEKLDALYKAE